MYVSCFKKNKKSILFIQELFHNNIELWTKLTLLILFADNNELMVEACVMILDSYYRIRFKKRLYKKYLKLLGSKIKGYTSERHNTL